MTHGVFIGIEGLDGTGKTTQAKRLTDHLQNSGIDALYTREPGGTDVAERIRQIHLDTQDEVLTPLTELLLMYAARQQHLEEVIRPALTQGQWVVCDRFIDTTFAYQIRGHRLPPEYFHTLNQWVVKQTAPDVTLFFTLENAIQKARISARQDEQNRLDTMGPLYRERVVSGLIERSITRSHLVIDAAGDMDTVTKRMLAKLTPFLNLEHIAERRAV